MKLFVIRARVSTKMKRELEKLAVMRGEAEAVLIREALRAYIKRNAPTIAKRRAPADDLRESPPRHGSLMVVS